MKLYFYEALRENVSMLPAKWAQDGVSGGGRGGIAMDCVYCEESVSPESLEGNAAPLFPPRTNLTSCDTCQHRQPCTFGVVQQHCVSDSSTVHAFVSYTWLQCLSKPFLPSCPSNMTS